MAESKGWLCLTRRSQRGLTLPCGRQSEAYAQPETPMASLHAVTLAAHAITRQRRGQQSRTRRAQQILACKPFLQLKSPPCSHRRRTVLNTRCARLQKSRSKSRGLACSCSSILRRPVLPQRMLDRTPRARVPQTRQPLAPTTPLCAAERSPNLQPLLAMQAHAHLETTHVRGKPLAQVSVAQENIWSIEKKLTNAQHTAVPVPRSATVRRQHARAQPLPKRY